MASVKESTWQRIYVKWLKSCYKCEVLKIMLASENDWPDLLIFIAMHGFKFSILIECKKKDKRLRPSQQDKHDRLKEVCSIAPQMFDNIAEAKDFIINLEQEAKILRASLNEKMEEDICRATVH